jgi:hypothetical protein
MTIREWCEINSYDTSFLIKDKENATWYSCAHTDHIPSELADKKIKGWYMGDNILILVV